jgi:enoyl-CoA hydratase/carnithine racemase
MEKTVIVEVRAGVATVTLNRADGANALDLAMGRDLLEATCAAWRRRASRWAVT